MIFFRASRYLKHLILSRHWKGHGIHSPFVFDLVFRVFRNKIDPDIVRRIEMIRTKLKSDHRTITVSDLGSGSEKLKTDLRKVSDIARNSSVPKKYGVLLSNMAAEFGESHIVEFGTSLGISTMYMAVSCKNGIVYTMEGCPETAEIAAKNFKDAGLKNIKIFAGSFDGILPELSKSGIKPQLVFIDGNHRKGPVIRYFKQMSILSGSNMVIIIDDIHNSKEMEDAWNEIKRCEKVSHTVDIFRMGIVFFRDGIIHNNYIIRY